MFKEQLKIARNNAGFSQKELAEKLYLSQQAYAKYESGTATPKLETLQKLSEILNVSLISLLPDETQIQIKENERQSREERSRQHTIHYYRQAKGLTVEELSDQCGISPETLKDYEFGRTEPRKETLLRIAESLDVDENDIYILRPLSKKIIPGWDVAKWLELSGKYDQLLWDMDESGLCHYITNDRRNFYRITDREARSLMQLASGSIELLMNDDHKLTPEKAEQCAEKLLKDIDQKINKRAQEAASELSADDEKDAVGLTDAADQSEEK